MSDQSSQKELDALLEQAVRRHGNGRDALIPILSEVNKSLGYIPAEAFGKIRRRLNTPQEGLFLADSHVFAVASFYQMLSLQPTGAHVIRYCESAPCHVVGARQVLEAIQDELGILPGQTTHDREWSLIPTSCIGVCGVGPVFLIDQDLYGNVTPDHVHEILDRYR